MGNSNGSANNNSRVCTGTNAPGLNQYCYTSGYDAASSNSTPDAVGEALGAALCLSNVNANNFFYCPNKIDFNLSSSLDPTEISVYKTVSGNPSTYLLKKSTQAISGQVKATTLAFGSAERFSIRTIQDSNIIK